MALVLKNVIKMDFQSESSDNHNLIYGFSHSAPTLKVEKESGLILVPISILFQKKCQQISDSEFLIPYYVVSVRSCKITLDAKLFLISQDMNNTFI